jgi:putative endonuclease
MYVGMTNNLPRRLYEHRTSTVKGFTEKYNVHKLVYFEETADVHAAIAREKEIKKWRREKKNGLVIQVNPEWRDLGNDLGLYAGPTVNSTRTQDFSQAPRFARDAGRNNKRGGKP